MHAGGEGNCWTSVKFCETNVRIFEAKPSWRAGGVSLAAAVFLMPTAAAQSQSSILAPFSLRAASTFTWDDNVFRLPASSPDPQSALGKPGKSDRFTATTFGFRFDKAYSLQQFQFDFSNTATRYDKFTSLNREANQYQGSWLWHLGPRITGVLGTGRSETTVDFEDSRGLQRIVSVSTTRNVNVDGRLFGGWHLLAGASTLESKNSQAFLALPNATQTSGDLGLKYVAESQSSITFNRRSTSGRFPVQAVDLITNLVGTGFSERTSELNATWIVSGKSTLSGRLTRIERRNEQFPQRDFARTGGELRYSWMPTGRLGLTVSALRNVSPFLQPTSSFREDNTFSIGPTWTISSKTTLSMGANRTISEYLGPVVAVAGPVRRDVMRGQHIGIGWTPHASVTLGATLRQTRRTSTDSTLNFDDTSMIATASLAF